MANITDLRSAVQLACQPQGGGKILRGREQVVAMPRDWVIEQIEAVAKDALNLDDYWEYRRFLELCELLNPELVTRVATWGIASDDPDVREASEDFSAESKDAR